MENTENSTKQRDYSYLKQYQWKKGETGNAGGRPKDTMKDYLRRKFNNMSDEEKEEWLAENKVAGDMQIRLAEGNPSEDKNIKITAPKPILGGTTQDSLPIPVHTDNTAQLLDVVATEVEREVFDGNSDTSTPPPVPQS